MNLRRPEVRTPPETIIALIDVVFFLLAFFMLIGRLDATAPFSVVPPVGTTGADLPAGGATISVSADGELALDGIPLARAEIMDRLVAPDPANAARQVRINAHHAVELRQVLPLISALEEKGVDDIVIVVSPQQP